MIAGFFGGYYPMKYVHNISGLVFVASGLFAVIVWFKEGTKFTVNDIEWLSRAGGYLWANRIVPESGRFNAGQKLYYLLKSVTWILMSITGLIIWFPFLFSRVMVSNSYWLHALGVAVLAGSVIIHIFLGTFGNPGSVQSMLGGKCTRAWVRLQHGRWLREYDSKQK